MVSPIIAPRVHRTMCPMNCHPTYCGMLVEIEDDRVVSITGDPDNPDSRGFLCVRGRAVKDLPDNPNRFRTPLLRDRRGGDFREASWDEALDRIAERIEARPRHQTALWPGHGVFVNGVGGTLTARFAHLAGAHSWQPAIVCWGLGGFGLWLTGVTEVNTAQDMAENAELILLWGANLASQPTTGPHLAAARRRGARVIVIDVRKSEAFAQADESYIVRPGSDAHLALAMMHVIVGEGLIDRDFIAGHTTGFDELAAHLERYPPRRAAGATGLTTAQIEHLARTFAASKRAMLLVGGSSMNKTANAWYASRAIACLPALTGSLGRPGAGLGPRHSGQPHGFGLASVVPPTTVPLEHRIPSEMSSILAGLESGAIRNLLLLGTNILSSYAGAARVRRAAEKLDLVVAFDLFLNESSRELADVILPGTSWLEETGYKMTNAHFHLMDAALSRRGEARPLVEVLGGLAERLQVTDFFPWASMDAFIDQLLAAPATAGTTVAGLRGNGRHAALAVSGVGHPELEFSTPSGKVEFVSERAREFGLPALPVAEDRTPADGLTFVQGRTIAHFHGFYDHGRELPMLREADPRPLLWIHPVDAQARAITDGAEVAIHNPDGRMGATAHVTPEIAPGTVWMHDGWAGLNTLTSAGRVLTDAAARAFPQGGGAAYTATVEVDPA
jgi:anaerobic selenocysteine-containing dehydrogenase